MGRKERHTIDHISKRLEIFARLKPEQAFDAVREIAILLASTLGPHCIQCLIAFGFELHPKAKRKRKDPAQPVTPG